MRFSIRSMAASSCGTSSPRRKRISTVSNTWLGPSCIVSKSPTPSVEGSASIIRRVRQIIDADPSTDGVGDLLTMQLGPNQVLLTVDIRFRRGLDVPQLEAAIDRMENRIRREEPTIQRIFIEADSLKPTVRRP